MKKNPWVSLPAEHPFLFPGDRGVVNEFNNRTTNPNYRIETRLLPEPFVGSINAPILLLLLNPGVSAEDFALQERPDFQRRVRACHRQESRPYPNYYLHPNMSGSGARWTARVLKPLLNEFSERVVAASVTFVEYFPYHSRQFNHHRIRVPSQEFTFQVVRNALRQQAVVFISRGQTIWEEAVPELRLYSLAFTTRSKQNVVISPRNCPSGYEAAQAALRKVAAD
jgi:hypothetical protein